MFHGPGSPSPRSTAAIHADDGGWLAEGDLRLAGPAGHRASTRGAVHAGIRNRSRDSYRNGLLADEGWRVLEIFAEDLADAPRRVRPAQPVRPRPRPRTLEAGWSSR